MKRAITRIFVLLVLCGITLASFAQRAAECDFEGRRLLTTEESKFLNQYFAKSNFDFTCKKIAFFTGNTGNIISNKDEFFKKAKLSDSIPIGGIVPFAYFEKFYWSHT